MGFDSEAKWVAIEKASSWSRRREGVSESDWLDQFAKISYKKYGPHLNDAKWDFVNEKFAEEFNRFRKFLNHDSSILEIGGGAGRLSIPLATLVDKVTVLEPSETNLELLRERARWKGIDNLVCIKGLWSDFRPREKYDLVFSAWCPAIRDVSSLIKMHEASKGYCAIETEFTNLCNRELQGCIYPLIIGEKFQPSIGPIDIIAALYQKGVYANLETWNFESKIEYDNMDEAMEFWKTWMEIYTEIVSEMEEQLCHFYQSHMNPDGSYCYTTKGVSCMIWWHV